ncbi:AAA family ATPase [Candidatus Woesearchaeota archaeon]|nr:MAG: AAA family ATPase [Candidatus Woesearchaeota archaeon]
MMSPTSPKRFPVLDTTVFPKSCLENFFSCSFAISSSIAERVFKTFARRQQSTPPSEKKQESSSYARPLCSGSKQKVYMHNTRKKAYRAVDCLVVVHEHLLLEKKKRRKQERLPSTHKTLNKARKTPLKNNTSAMTWYTALGFKENPLDIRPNPRLVGLQYEEELLKNFILKGELCFLTGLTGSGKSSLLRRVEQTLPGHTFIYLDAQDLPPGFRLEDELKKKRSFFDRLRLRNFPSKTPVLLIDEFQDTDPRLVLEARAKWENKQARRIKAIIIAQIDKVLRNVTPAFKERLGNRIIELRTLDSDEMKDIIRLRLKRGRKNFSQKIEEEALGLLVACADGNPRRLLEYTELLFDFHHTKFGQNNPLIKNPRYRITYHAAREILAVNGINVAQYSTSKPRARGIEAFKKKFNQQERALLRFLMTGQKTYRDIARHLRTTKANAKKQVQALKRKEAVVYAGKRGKDGLFEAAPKIKRLRVNV